MAKEKKKKGNQIGESVYERISRITGKFFNVCLLFAIILIKFGFKASETMRIEIGFSLEDALKAIESMVYTSLEYIAFS